MTTLLLLAGLAAAAPAKAPPHAKPAADVLVTVDGLPIGRKEVADRLWRRYASEELNRIVDDLVVNKAVTAWRLALGEEQRKQVESEIETRVGRIRRQFKDEAAFEESLRRNGTNIDAVKTEVRDQVERERLVISAKKLSVSPEEVRQAYDANRDRLAVPSLRLRQLVVPDAKQAADLLTALKVGADFAKLAEKVSIDQSTKDKGGNLDWVSMDVLAPELAQALLAVKPGEVSGVIRLPGGFHIFLVEARKDPPAPSFEEAAKGLEAALLGQKIARAWPDYVAELRAATTIVPAAGVTVGPGARPN